MLKLSEAERAAICILHERGGSMLTSNIPDKNERSIFAGVFGIEPGMAVYKKLEKKGLVFFTEEEPMEDGFVFTNEVYLTDEGKSHV
jgi:hypothetical protein